MKKLLFSLLIPIAIMAVSCGNAKTDKGNSALSDSDSCSETITPEDVSLANQVGVEQSVCGVTLDRAMNSIFIITEKGDSISFGYADVDNRTKFASSNIGDTVTVKYVKLTNGQDSVTAILLGKKP